MLSKKIKMNSEGDISDLEFLRLLPLEISEHPNDLHLLRECLTEVKNRGMEKDAMIINLEKLALESDDKTENILLDLMDFVSGWCNLSLSIFE